ncbi:hypothetical protein [uncultured Fusobacterium sp.]|uniref:hypothetical protein n=1 Tax=uncultured Fusobacterium sp. TaxID=159267 RepID=UPI0027DAFF9D|nr:hypothetical protein [uncultured Fusobacterium sp.]
MNLKTIILTLILIVIFYTIPEMLGANKLDQRFYEGIGFGIFCYLSIIKAD